MFEYTYTYNTKKIRTINSSKYCKITPKNFGSKWRIDLVLDLVFTIQLRKSKNILGCNNETFIKFIQETLKNGCIQLVIWIWIAILSWIVFCFDVTHYQWTLHLVHCLSVVIVLLEHVILQYFMSHWYLSFKEKYIHKIEFISALQTIYIWTYIQPAHQIGKGDSLIAVQSNTWPGTWPGPWLGIGNGWFWPPENPTYRGPSMLKQSANVVL